MQMKQVVFTCFCFTGVHFRAEFYYFSSRRLLKTSFCTTQNSELARHNLFHLHYDTLLDIVKIRDDDMRKIG